MSWTIGVLAASFGVWILTRRAAGRHNKPNWWDYSDLLAGMTAIALTAPTLLLASDYPLAIIVHRTLVMGVGVAVTGWMWGLMLEEWTDWLPRPDTLAPPADRIRGQQTLDDGPGPEIQSPDGPHEVNS